MPQKGVKHVPLYFYTDVIKAVVNLYLHIDESSKICLCFIPSVFPMIYHRSIITRALEEIS